MPDANETELADLAPEAELFDGEALEFDVVSDDDGDLTDLQIDEKYAAGQVRIVTEQARYPLNTVAGLVDSGDYELNPEFQRRLRWSRERQSRLIESFIMNVPVPPIFLYEDEFSHYEVMDGLQRLTAISDFYKGEFELEGLTEWASLNGRTYRDLPDKVRRGIDRRFLSSIILLRETAKSDIEAQRLKQLVFERINSGGETLTPQETRNALYDGPMNRLCLKLSRNEDLCRLWEIPPPSEIQTAADERRLREHPRYRKMDDVELVLRFFAHRQRRRVGTGAFNEYLDLYLKQANLFPEPTLDRLESLFEQTIALVRELFEDGAFWLWRFRHGTWGWLERPATSVYDSLMYVTSQRLDQREELLQAKEYLAAALPSMYEQYFDQFEGRKTNMRNIRERDALFSQLFDQALQEPS